MRDVADNSTGIVDGGADAFGIARKDEKHIVGQVLTFQFGAIGEATKQQDNISVAVDLGVRWPVDWTIALVAPVLVTKGVSAGYGYKHASHSIFYPASPWGDLEVALAYLSQNEAYEDIAEYLATELSGSIPVGLPTASDRRPGMTRLHTENTTGFPSLSDAFRDRAPCRHSWSTTVH